MWGLYFFLIITLNTGANLLGFFLTKNFYFFFFLLSWSIANNVNSQLRLAFVLFCFIIYSTPYFNTFELNIGLQNRLFLVHPLLLLFTFVSFIRFFQKYIKVFKSTNFFTPTYFNNMCLFVWVSIMLFLGGYWAQQEFNWGGWWSWDSVELTSLCWWLALMLLFHYSQKPYYLYLRVMIFLFYIMFLILLINRSNIFSSIHNFSTTYKILYFYLFIYFYLFFFILVKPWILPYNRIVLVMYYTIQGFILLWIYCITSKFLLLHFKFLKGLSLLFIFYIIWSKFGSRMVTYRAGAYWLVSWHTFIYCFFFYFLSWSFGYKVYMYKIFLKKFFFIIYWVRRYYVGGFISGNSVHVHFLKFYKLLIFFKPLFLFKHNYLYWYFKQKYTIFCGDILFWVWF